MTDGEVVMRKEKKKAKLQQMLGTDNNAPFTDDGRSLMEEVSWVEEEETQKVKCKRKIRRLVCDLSVWWLVDPEGPFNKRPLLKSAVMGEYVMVVIFCEYLFWVIDYNS